MLLENNKSLINLNTFGVNYFAEKFVNIITEEILKESINYIIKNKIKYFVLGGGSNILITKNIEGIVLFNQLKGIEITSEDENSAIIKVQSGVVWNDLVNWSIKNNLWGIENLILIPGTVGAAPIQNIGAYGVEIKDVFKSLTAYCFETREKIKFNKEDCSFGYRESVFKNKLKNKFFITEVEVELSKNKKPILNYEALNLELRESNLPITLKNIGKIVSEIRNKKLPDPKKLGNSGSFFKNPIIDIGLLNEIKKKFPDVKYFSHNNKIKISAGWLIEKCDWKGKKINNCGVYEKQALVLVNFGNSSGKEISDLSIKIKKDVKNKFNIDLIEEVQII